MYDFEDIRPYHDHEVRPVVDALVQGKELSRALAGFKFPRLHKLCPPLVTRLMQLRLRRELSHVNNVHDIQIAIEKYLDRLLENTTSSLTHNGLERLDSGRPYLFISNHRDITMDPALVNYMLYHQGFDTLQIAIGDNLVKKPFLSDLMRLNKSFIVRRSAQGRAKLKVSKQLSAYIHYCIQNGENVWIAQREGRAKDGNDKTESAIIKMLHISQRETEPKLSLAQAINALNIVPVSISYEFDPCDEAKARELHAVQTLGTYQKDEDSDEKSILHGMVGHKGDVHVAYGIPLQVEEGATAEAVAQMIDRQVVTNYKLHLVNYLALQALQPEFMDFNSLPFMFGLSEAQVTLKREQLEQRLAPIEEHLRPFVLRMYANPVLRQAEMVAAEQADITG